jgi:hypothetical protein
MPEHDAGRDGLDVSLRAIEDAERQALLSRRQAQARRMAGDSCSGALRAELESLRFFRQAVLESRVWKLTQFLRALVGRRWQV